MAKSLTVASIEKLKPDPQRRCEVPDGRLPGLYLIIQPGGAKSWAVRYRYGGRSRKFTIGPYPAFDLTAARQEASQALQRAQRGGDPAHEKRLERRRKTEAKDDFESVVRLFIERYSKQNNRTWGRVARAFGLVPSNDEPCAAWPAIKGGLVARWGDRRIGDIARIDIIDLLDAIVARGAPIMANRTLAHLRKLFNWALDSELVTASPCAGVKPRAPEQSRDRVLNDAELKALWRAAEAMQGQFGPIVQLLILTGQRREEVGGMRWSEIDLDEKLWTLPASRVKNKTKHTVPLSAAAVAIIQGLPRRKGVDFVFSTTGRGSVSGFSRAKEHLNALTAFSDWRLHDIRRTVASGMARLGIALPVIEKVLNHRSGSFAGIVGVYHHHSYSEEKRHALDTWARFITTLVGESADNVVALRV